jgi:hypothetical protein
MHDQQFPPSDDTAARLAAELRTVQDVLRGAPWSQPLERALIALDREVPHIEGTLPGMEAYELVSKVHGAIELALYEWTTEIARAINHVWQARQVLDDLWDTPEAVE